MGGQSRLVLIVTNSRDATSDFLEKRLNKEQVQFVRLNTDQLGNLPIRFHTGPNGSVTEVRLGERWRRPEHFTSVYYRRPTLPDLRKIPDLSERLWAANEFRKAWGGFFAQIPPPRWVNHPPAITQSSYKLEQLNRAVQLGLRVPETLVTTDPGAAREFCERLEWRVIAKPVGHGEIRDECGDTTALIYTNEVGKEALADLSRVANCPTLLQEHLPKARDIRVTVIDEHVVSVALHSQDRPRSRVDCRRDNMEGMKYSLLELPEKLSATLVDFTKSYALRFAAIDLVEGVQEEFWFLELNPAGQWAWIEQELGTPISQALVQGFLRDSND